MPQKRPNNCWNKGASSISYCTTSLLEVHEGHKYFKVWSPDEGYTEIIQKDDEKTFRKKHPGISKS
jgi:hypothetical protein